MKSCCSSLSVGLVSRSVTPSRPPATEAGVLSLWLDDVCARAHRICFHTSLSFCLHVPEELQTLLILT